MIRIFQESHNLDSSGVTRKKAGGEAQPPVFRKTIPKVYLSTQSERIF